MNARRVAVAVCLVVAAAAAGGCGTQGRILNAEAGVLLQGFDTLARPGETVKLTARLQGGDYLRGMEGYLVGFSSDNLDLGKVRTDQDGFAWIDYAPESAGDTVVLARLEDLDVQHLDVEPAEIIVAARESSAPMVVVDLDHTLVKSGFDEVLTGRPKPMPHSEVVLERLDVERTIVYLTHRPDIFTRSTKQWLRKHDYPLGPLLTSTLSEFFSGSQKYKTAALENLTALYDNIEVGIGDKVGDAKAYAANGLHPILVIHPDHMRTPVEVRRWMRDLRDVPESADVVTSWRQIEAILFDGARHPASEALEMLRDLLAERQREALEQSQDGTGPEPAGQGDTR